MRHAGPGPRFWIGVILLLNLRRADPRALDARRHAMVASLVLDRPPGADDRWLVTALAYACLLAVALPGAGRRQGLQHAPGGHDGESGGRAGVLPGGGRAASSALRTGGTSSAASLKFGTVPTWPPTGGETTVNVFAHAGATGPGRRRAGQYRRARGVRRLRGRRRPGQRHLQQLRPRQGLGHGQHGRRDPQRRRRHGTSRLSHLGKVFDVDAENLRRWRGWWRYILTDQVFVWAPGCFMGMALPALLSLRVRAVLARSPATELEWAQALITADGIRHAPQFSAAAAQAALDRDRARRPDGDAAQPDVDRRRLQPPLDRHHLVGQPARPRSDERAARSRRIYYTILGSYVALVVRLRVPLQHLRHAEADDGRDRQPQQPGHRRHLVPPVWINRTAAAGRAAAALVQPGRVLLCGVFYLGLAALVFVTKQWPVLRELLKH